MVLPKITVITPTFNTGETIEISLLSVAKQTYKNVEHIIVDGASKDKTLPTIRRYQKLYKNIRLLTEKDEGIYPAMNKGLDLSTGDWIIFLGADDAFYNDQVLADLFDQGFFQEEQVVYGNVMIKGDAPWAKNNSIYDGPFTLEKLFRWNICHQSIFYPKSVIKKVGYYETKYKVTSDWDYNIRCWAKYKFIYTEAIIAFFTTGGKSSESGDYALHLDFPNNVIKYFQLDVLDSNLYLATSPFYYAMSRYRENEHVNNILELKAEADRLKQHLSDERTEHSESVTSMQIQHEQLTASMRSEFDATISTLKTEQENYFNTFTAAQAEIVQRLKTEHEEVVANLKKERDEGLATLQNENYQANNNLIEKYDLIITNLKDEHDQFITNLKDEHNQFINNLKGEHSLTINNLQDEHIEDISRIKEVHDLNLTNLTSEHNQVVFNLKEVQEITTTNLRTEHTLIVSNLNTQHDQIIANLKAEHSEMIVNLKAQHNEVVTGLKIEHGLSVAELHSDHLESIGTLKDAFEEIVQSLQAEQSASEDIFRQKEAEYIQILASNNQRIDLLDHNLADNELLFRETVKKYSEEIANLEEEILAKNQRIATILDSYTWKTGKVLLAPVNFISRKAKK